MSFLVLSEVIKAGMNISLIIELDKGADKRKNKLRFF